MIRHRVLPIVLGCAVLLGIPATAPAQEPQSPQQQASAAAGAEQRAVIVVPAGTTLKLMLRTGFSTANSRPGQPLLLTTLEPVAVDGRIVIPAQSDVYGILQEVKRPGRARGRGQALIRLERLVLPNGHTVAIHALPTKVGAGRGITIDGQGLVTGPSGRRQNAALVAREAGVGALLGFGATFGYPKGAAVGAGVGASVGLATAKSTRGPELELPAGATIEATLQRPLELDAARTQFSEAGRATVVQIPGRPLDQDSARRWP